MNNQKRLILTTLIGFFVVLFSLSFVNSVTFDNVTVTNNLTVGKNVTFDEGTFFVNSVNNRVGIGTTTPQNALNVLGDLNVTRTISSDKLIILPDDETFTDADFNNQIGTSNTYTLDFVNARFGSLIRAGQTLIFNQNGNPFGSMSLFNMASTVRNNANSNRNLGPIFGFVAQPSIEVDGGTFNQTIQREFVGQTVFKRKAGSTGTILNTEWTHLYLRGTVDTGATSTTRRGVWFNDPTGSGTITTQIALDIRDITRATNNIGIRSVMTAGTNNYFISHTGTAQSDFGGVVNITSNLTVDSSTLFVDSVNNRVGIGTETPQQTFNVVGDGNFTGNFHAEGIRSIFGNAKTSIKINNNASDVNSIDFDASGLAGTFLAQSFVDGAYAEFDKRGDFFIENQDSFGRIMFKQGNNLLVDDPHIIITNMSIEIAPMVGINTSTPQNTLNVLGTTNSTLGFIVGPNVGVTANYSIGACWIAFSGGIAYSSNCTEF